MNDRQRLEAIVDVVRSYLPPDGISREEAMSQIIGLVDPLPAQPEQAPVAYFWRDTKLCYWIGHGSPKIDFQDLANLDVKPLYTAPPSKRWVSLNDDEIIDEYCKQADGTEWAIGGLKDAMPFARAIEAALKGKNNGN